MTGIIKFILSLILGYLLGSLNTALIVGTIIGKDIRSHGSKNAGLANAIRVFGKPALLVFAGDILKGVAACLIGLFLGVNLYWGDNIACVSLLAAGIGAIIGHNWPVYFGFRGGKGVLTAVAVMFMANWAVALIGICVYAAIVALTRYSSLGSICATFFAVAVSFIPAFGNTLYFYIFACFIAAMIIFRHRENIKRLVSGTENKLF